MDAVVDQPVKCSGTTPRGCGGEGFRVPAGVNGAALACAPCDGSQLVVGVLSPRPAGGYDRSHFEG